MIRIVRESEIEKKVCQYARSKDWLTYKFVSPSNRGVPDRIFIRSGNILFIEFKSPGKHPTKLQNKVIDRIRSQDFNVYVIDSLKDGYKIVDSFEK